MPTGGLSITEGFIPKTLEEIQGELEALVLTEIDASLDLSADQPIGQLIGIFARKLAELWELGSVAYHGFDPDVAQNYLLDAICALTGIRRRPASKSVTTCTVNLNAGATLPAGAVANVASAPENRWLNTAEVTNSGGSAANFTATFECEKTGPNTCNIGTLTVITVPVSGWNTVTNTTTATLGINEDTDTVLRARRLAALTQAGGSTVDALRADLMAVDGVIQAFVFENTTMVYDANYLPPKSIECVVWDGPTPEADNDELGAVIWAGKPSGIVTKGSTSVTTEDSLGDDQTVRFSRAEQKNVYLEFDIKTGAGWNGTTGPAAIKTAAKTWGDSYFNLGIDVVAALVKAQVFAVTGVFDVPALRLGYTVSPGGTSNLTVTSRQIAIFDTTRMTVTVTGTGGP